MRLILLCLAMLFLWLIPTRAEAQENKKQIAVFAGVYEPSSDMRSFASTGFGAGLAYYHYLGPTIALQGRIAYHVFGEGTSGGEPFQVAVIPVEVGFDVFLSRSVYLTGLGAYYFPAGDLEEGGMGFQGGIGWAKPVSRRGNQIKIEGTFQRVFGPRRTLIYFGLSAGYAFTL